MLNYLVSRPTEGSRSPLSLTSSPVMETTGDSQHDSVMPLYALKSPPLSPSSFSPFSPIPRGVLKHSMSQDSESSMEVLTKRVRSPTMQLLWSHSPQNITEGKRNLIFFFFIKEVNMRFYKHLTSSFFAFFCSSFPFLFQSFFSGSEASWGEPAGSFLRAGDDHRASSDGSGCYRFGGGLGISSRRGLFDRSGVGVRVRAGGDGGAGTCTPARSPCLDTGSEEEEHGEEAQIVTLQKKERALTHTDLFLKTLKHVNCIMISPLWEHLSCEGRDFKT